MGSGADLAYWCFLGIKYTGFHALRPVVKLLKLFWEFFLTRVFILRFSGLKFSPLMHGQHLPVVKDRGTDGTQIGDRGDRGKRSGDTLLILSFLLGPGF